MIVLLIIAAILYGNARRNGQNQILWPVIGIASYFLGQFVGGFLLLGKGSMNFSYGDAVIYQLAGGVIAVIIVGVIMQVLANNEKALSRKSDKEIIDDEFIEEI